LRCAFEGNAANPLGQFEMFWISGSHVTKQSMNGGEPDVSCRCSVLAFPLAVLSDEGAIVRQPPSAKHSARYRNASTGKQLTRSLEIVGEAIEE
jgi:hypothetical protein